MWHKTWYVDNQWDNPMYYPTFHFSDSVSAESRQGQSERLAAYPNPFNPSVSIGIPPALRAGKVDIFSVDGRRVAAIDTDRKSLVRWDAASFSPGVYIVRVAGEKGTAEKRVLLIK